MTDGSNDRDNSEVPDEYLPQKALQRLLEQKKGSTVDIGDKKSKQTQQQGEQDDADLENMLHLHDDEEDEDNESKEKANGDASEDANDDDVDIDNAGSNLLDSLTTDIAKYHKKVEEKKKSQLKTPNTINKPSAESSSSKNLKRSHEADKNNSEEDAVDDGNNNDDSITDPSILGDIEDEANSNSSKIPRKRGRKNPIAWSKAEDDAIVYYKEELKYSWKRIEELLERKHSWQAIQMRYLRNHKSRNEDWSRFMEIKLMNEIKKDWEHRWKRISNKLGKDFNSERCYSKTVEICRKMDTDYFTSVFQNKTICQGYENPITDIKDAEAHKKLMLIYMGLDSISYDDYEDVANQIDNINDGSSKADDLKAAEENVKAIAESSNSENAGAGNSSGGPGDENLEKTAAKDESSNPVDVKPKKGEIVEGETEKQ